MSMARGTVEVGVATTEELEVDDVLDDRAVVLEVDEVLELDVVFPAVSATSASATVASARS